MHVSILSGANIPVISWGALGVDLFILLSGFLMVHQSEERKHSEPWSEYRTFAHFWTRRFFRIAPLYYVLLTASFTAAPILSRSRIFIGEHYQGTFTNGLRYTDASLANVLTHFTFAFGFLPHYAFQTALPDWSIGLEMQFYLGFPLFMLFVSRFGYAWLVACILALDIALYAAFPAFYGSFLMPSFLPLKINLFLLGMLIAAAFHHTLSVAASAFFVVLPFVPLFIARHQGGLGIVADILLAAALYALTQNYQILRSALKPLRWLLNSRPCQYLGKISYSVYLLHLLLVLPISATLLRLSWVTSLSRIPRFCIVFSASALFVLPLSSLLYRYIEKPGVALGNRLLRRANGNVTGIAKARPA
jgi:peptidoglycan/LPS O-acetylase OafA/YrhL